MLLGLEALLSKHHEFYIQVQSDNTTTVFYINHKEGTHSTACNFVAKDIWFWRIARDIWISAVDLPGVSNHIANKAFRVFNNRTECQLNPMVFASICKKMFVYPD